MMTFSQEEKDNFYKLCAAIMHLGEMKFKQRPREEQAEIDDITGATKQNGIRVAAEYIYEVITQQSANSEGELAGKLLTIDSDKFVNALLKPRVKVGAEWVNRGQNLDQVSLNTICRGIQEAGNSLHK